MQLICTVPPSEVVAIGIAENIHEYGNVFIPNSSLEVGYSRFLIYSSDNQQFTTLHF